MKYKRVILTLAVLGVPLAGCSPDWFQRSADREVARIVEQRKEDTLKYKPQTEAKVPKQTEPTTRAYEKIPVTAMVSEQVGSLDRQDVGWTPEPLGPAIPSAADENYDFVPPSYATFGVAMDPQGPPTPGVESNALDLFGSIAYGVTHARDYRDRMEDLFLSTLDVTLQRHLFEPRPFATTDLNFVNRQQYDGNTPTNYKQALAVVNTAGIRQQLPYGGEIVAQQIVSITDTLNNNSQDAQSAETSLKASIPLLRGAGLVNLEPLINSERQLVYSVRNFETFRRRFVVDIASRFFSLISQQQSIKNRRQNYETLKILSERSISLFAAGRLQFLDVQRALQNQLNAESSLIDAVNAYQASLDSYKIVLGMPVEADLDVVPVEMQVNLPDLQRVDSSALAVKYRLDLQTVRDQVEDARRGVSNAKNGLLPNVTLTGRTGVGNPPGERWNHYNDETEFAEAGLSIDWPIDELAERNFYRRSLITLARAERAYVTSREQVISDVRQVERRLRVAQATLAIQRKSVDLNQKRLDLANERFVQGRAAVLDVTDAQSALLNAQDALDRARADLQTQVLQYLRDTGTLRLNPQAGELARAMDRAAVQVRTGQPLDEIEREAERLERQ